MLSFSDIKFGRVAHLPVVDGDEDDGWMDGCLVVAQAVGVGGGRNISQWIYYIHRRVCLKAYYIMNVTAAQEEDIVWADE